ncbi:HWE histidine kinase domain-containing protein [Roseivivax sp. CAU 1753]
MSVNQTTLSGQARQDPDGPDLTACDRENIHLLGRVQSYGALLAVTSDWVVQHASENLGAVLHIAARNAIGASLATLLGVEPLNRIRQRMRDGDGDPRTMRMFDFTIGRRRYDLSIHQSGRYLVFEFEPCTTVSGRDVLSDTYLLVDRLRRATTLDALCREGARGLQALSGFDSVMVYRFGRDRSGTVIAETLRGNGPTYLGLRFPASDIPQQARALYKRSLLRLIADVSDPGAVILPESTPGDSPLDLSLAVTRAVSPVHLEYLRNMGVQASMSVSILKDDDLWGLFACHHPTPRYITFEQRTAIELFAHLFAFELMQFATRQANRTEALVAQVQTAVLLQVTVGSDLAPAIRDVAGELRSVVAHDGVMLYTDRTLTCWGDTPDRETFPDLLRFLHTNTTETIFVSDSLSEDYPEAATFLPGCAGILAIPFSRSKQDYLIFCRREVAGTVSWAGKPEAKQDKVAADGRLTPRKSFETWQETVMGKSEAWSDTDLHAAKLLRALLREVILRVGDEVADEHHREQERQARLIAELNHRIRNILTLTRGLVSQSRDDTMTVESFAQNLDGRLHAMALAHDQLSRTSREPLSVADLLGLEFAAYATGAATRLRLSGDDVLVSPAAYAAFALVFHELVTNAAKYGALSVADGHVEVALGRTSEGDLRIDWKDVGGPPVSAPTRRGFGSSIIESAIPFDLGGTAVIDYPPDGLTARFTVPGKHLTDAAQDLPAGESAGSATGKIPSLTGKALVVEDSMIVAMDASGILSDFGATTTEVAGTVHDALALIERHDFEVALLDVKLGQEQSVTVAQRLADLGVPFVLSTGHGDVDALRRRYPMCKVVQKPFSTESIAAALVQSGLRTR